MEDSRTDEEIIETRLIANENKLNKCLKHCNVLCATVNNKEKTAQDSHALMLGLSKELTLFEQSMTSAGLVETTNHRELECYEGSQAEIEKSITSTTAEISQLKEELAREKIIRMQKEEYELLVKQIMQYPSQQETNQQIDTINQALATAQAEKQKQTTELEHKRKQFGLFFHSLALLQSDGAMTPAPTTTANGTPADGDVEMGE